MYGSILGYGPANITRAYSPVTLNYEWPPLERLLFMVFCSCLGTILNGFFVAAFFIEHPLNRIGNVFLACIGLSDLILTGGVMPVSAVVLLSSCEWDLLPVCHALQFLTETSTYCYSIFYLMVAAESYYRLCRSQDEYQMFISMPIGLVSLFIFVLGMVMAAIGVYLNMDYDYCERSHHGNFYYRITTSIIFYAIPGVITFTGLVLSCISMRKHARTDLHYRRSQLYESDFSTVTLNISAFVIYVVMWIPYLVVVFQYPDSSDSSFYHCVWIGLSRSMFNNFLYSSLNRNFRRAFANLFNYCCCKNALKGTLNNRHRRGVVYKTTGDVRVHIMHQINTSAHRGQGSRDIQEL